MHRQRLSTIVWLGAVLALLAALGAGSLWWERASETAANQEAINSQEDSGVTLPEPELTQESDLPEHPLESMGIAKLTESQGMPEDAISEEEAIDLVTELTRGPERDFYLDKHSASAIPATYDAEENTMGPAADNLPVWVVVLDGWGPPVPCGVGLPPGWVDPAVERPAEDKSQSEQECITGKSNAYIIVDAVTGQHLASWHYGKPEVR